MCCFLLAKETILDNTTGEVVNEIERFKENIFDKIKKTAVFYLPNEMPSIILQT